MIFYTDRFIPKKSNACARAFVILIRPQYRGDRGLLEHERVHVRQSWRGLFVIHALRYAFSKKYRFACEVEAYKEQADWYVDSRLPNFAHRIANNYGLDVTEAEALAALTTG